MLVSLVAALFCVTLTLMFVTFLRRRRTVSSDGKAVLVTGCDRGFGSMLAVHLSAKGYQVFAGCLNASGEGASKLRQTSPSIDVIQLDVTSDQQVCLWAVVNNAGVACVAETEWCSLSQHQVLMDVNWMGTVRVTKAFLPLIRASRGRVINLASLAGRVALPGFSAYASSKFAVVGFSDSLRREMFKFGVKVITIEPAVYKTALLDFQALAHENEKMWREASQEVRHSYGETYFREYLPKLGRLLQHSSSKLNEVVDDLSHAVAAKNPYTRYVPRLLVNQVPSDMFSVSPNCFQDFVLDVIFKVPLRPHCAPKAD